jgi:sugar phosphate isomerase/epimerase
VKPISIQLYTLREAAAKDFPSVLRFLADTGYVGVEFAGLHGHTAKEIAGIIGDLGLKVSSSHTALPAPENIAELADTELTLGNTKVISGFGPDAFKTMDDIKAAADKFEQAAGLVEPYGMTFGIHNHWWEFAKVDGKYVYDILMAEAPDIFSELDVYWTAYGKADPVKVVDEYKSRLPLLHIKDGPLEEGKAHLAVGDGKLDMPAIIGAADPAVLEWLVVELDSYDGDMLDAVKRSYDYLTSKGLAAGNK